MFRLLNEAVNPSSKFIRQQDVEYIFEYLGQNDVARTLLWPFFTSHWNQLADLLKNLILIFNHKNTIQKFYSDSIVDFWV